MPLPRPSQPDPVSARRAGATRLARGALVVTTAALLVAPASATAAPSAQRGPDDAVVVAVIDSAFSPYHFDFSAAHMPQARTRDRGDDLPLTTAPDRWLPGFPSPRAFASYRPLKLHLETEDESVDPKTLDEADTAVWNGVQSSTSAAVNYYWIPGTKVVGAVTFGGKIHGPTSSHGVGTSSVSVGNVHGACPECLVVLIQYADQATGEAAIDWAMNQPWIDVVTNSYGFSKDGVTRSRIYSGSDTGLQKRASERGQTIFFSAGNGLDNSFIVPNTTLKSSQEGPDWIVTVTATDPNGGTYTGTGKPADVAGIGAGYPSGWNAQNLQGGSSFSGTSNATPTVAGMYARALHQARVAIPGRSRMQSGGVIAQGPLRCASVRRGCELADGRLTATELRFRLLHSAVSTAKGYTDGLGVVPPRDRVGDTHYAAEGHGTYTARLRGDTAWNEESRSILRPLLGTGQAPQRSEDEKKWFVVDSWCRQLIWGSWTGGYYVAGRTALPPSDAQNWPTRTAIRDSCPQLAAVKV